ncbi:MAG: hypothetical protein ACFE8B_08525 [Candidatus Hermodarchaeota archaeon]
MSEDTFKNKIRELESQLKGRDHEINRLKNTIEQLEDTIETREDTIMELEALKELEDGANTKSKKIQAAESRFAYELEEKEKYIRDLKNSMGMLRKDYIQLQQEFEKFKNSLKESSVIRVEDFREKQPLNALVADLQNKVNKQKSVINNLEYQLKESAEFTQKLLEKDEIIEAYKSEINDLNQKIKDFSSISQDKSADSITKNLIEDLQKQLNKSKSEIIDLKQKLSKYDKKGKKVERKEDSSEIKELKREVKVKDEEIDMLKNQIKAGGITSNLDQSDTPPSEMIKTLQDDLQNKLNKSKLEVKSLQEQINKLKSSKPIAGGESQKEIEGQLKMQREMAIFLQKQLETKDGEIETIKNEAVQIKKRYRQLENQLQMKDKKINELQNQIGAYPVQTPAQVQEEPNLALRLRELRGLISDLEKENVEQKLTIEQLRKK